MKINNIGYLLKEGIKGIFKRGFMSFAAVCVTVACLLIIGSFSLLMHNVNIIVQDLNKTNEVLAYIDSSLPDADARSVGTKINQVENVYKSKFISNEEALADFIAAHADEKDAFSGVVAEDLRHRFVVTLEDNALIDVTVERLELIPGVAEVKADFELAQGFITLQNVLGIISTVVISVLLVVSLLIISNTVKLAMHDRKDEISIMKMVGATNGFIRLPFVVQGFILGMLGAAIAFFMEWWGYNALIRYLEPEDALNLFNFVPFSQLLMPMICLFSAAGLFVGVLGSWASIRKFMNA